MGHTVMVMVKRWGYRHVVEFTCLSLLFGTNPKLVCASKGEALDSSHQTMDSRGPIGVTALGSASNHG